MIVIPVLAIVFALVALFLLWQAWGRQKASGLPSGRIIYSDTHTWGPVEAPLYDNELFLTGKPDYLMNGKDGIIPVEVKSSRVENSPYDSHIFQLAAYCRLVEANFGKRPRYGILTYPNQTIAIDYTPALEASLKALLEEIRADGRLAASPRKEIARSHHNPERCRGCGYKEICEQAL
jgi:CRISPR-associated exonuclease Cas4